MSLLVRVHLVRRRIGAPCFEEVHGHETYGNEGEPCGVEVFAALRRLVEVESFVDVDSG